VDLAILQKVLPKFHGTAQELQEPLRAVFAFAVAGQQPRETAEIKEETWVVDGDQIRDTAASERVPVMPRTAAKAWRMLRRLRAQGFTLFIE
jgi:5-methylcytosine-specific restriction protein B